MIRFMFFLFFLVVNSRVADAQGSGFDDFFIGGSNVAGIQFGGIHFKIPNAYISAPYYALSRPPFFTLKMALPSLAPLNSAEKADNELPDDDAPVVQATINFDPTAVLGTDLLNQIMAKVQTTCQNCETDNSLGGKEYSDYRWFVPYLPGSDYLNTPFNLYIGTSENPNFFFVCLYQLPSGKPLHCEVKEKLDNGLILTYWFPQDAASQVISIDSKLRLLLNGFQMPPATSSPDDIKKAAGEPKCWSPQQGTDSARIISLQVGPEILRIPQAYAASFGSNKTQNPQVDGFNVWLKLPDLEPLGPDDISPSAIAGHGRYLNFSISYMTDAMRYHPKLVAGTNGHVNYADSDDNYIGLDKFFNYQENELIKGGGLVNFFQNKVDDTFSAFPPPFFRCDKPGPGLSPGCSFQVIEQTTINVPGYPDAGYMLLYDFSRDYFSEIPVINACLEKLFDSFTGS